MRQFEVWLADLNPQIGTEPGKVRPVVIVQTNILNKVSHASTIICPITTQVIPNTQFLRINLKRGTAGLNENCSIMADQLRAIDNKRLVKKLGELPQNERKLLKSAMEAILDLGN